ncbi:MAG: chorismate synthase [Propionibacteriaceae bacterium]|jgi:chorismate synthase|nr:chorismate synthase [Propionibacteriaceae bacterium]
MLRYLTAGESHGPALTGILEGLPAHVRISTDDLASALARRRLGHGRGARMAFERDDVTIVGGVRHGETLGSPIAITIANTEWPKWESVMAADEVDLATVDSARNTPLTRPRPGHADLAGMQKYDFDEARPILERASARETATRVALGEFAKRFLAQALGVEIISHVVAIGSIASDGPLPTPADLAQIDADPVRCFDPDASAKMVARIDQAHADGDTLGGIIEVLVHGCPPGLGTHVSSDKRLDARLAAALMGIQAIKGVEIGDGFTLAGLPGSAAHDPMEFRDGSIARVANHAGGIEGGMSNGSVIRLRAAMKPIATVPHALPTVDVSTRTNAPAHHQRSDVCAVPAAGVIAEAMVALTLADAVLEVFGGDTVSDVRTRVAAYRERLSAAGLAMNEACLS